MPVSHLAPRPRRRALAAVLGLVVAAVACDVPTELPTWDTTWEVPAESTTLAVGELLPARVTLAPDSTAFLLAMDPVTFARSLGQACAACGPANGASVPKPAFNLTFGSRTTLPALVDSAALAGGSIRIQLTNGFGFDPIRPSATARGGILLEVSSRGESIATMAVDGTTTSFAPGTSLVRDLVLASRTIADSISVRITIQSPAGDAVAIDTAQRVSVTATVTEARLSAAAVKVNGTSVAFDDAELELDDIDSGVSGRVQGGELVLDVTNPFAVAGTFQATLSSADVTIEKALVIQPGASIVRLAFTAAELRSLLGAGPVTLAASGTATGTDASRSVILTPTQRLRIASRLRLTLSTTEQR